VITYGKRLFSSLVNKLRRDGHIKSGTTKEPVKHHYKVDGKYVPGRSSSGTLEIHTGPSPNHSVSSNQTTRRIQTGEFSNFEEFERVINIFNSLFYIY
jgi:hypothetical protein